MASSKPTIVIDCDICEARVAARIEGSYDAYVDAADHSVRYLLLRCPECDTGILAQQDDEDAGYCPDDDATRWANLVRLYPHSQGRKLGAAIPEAINKVFSEAYACWKSKAYAACAIMCIKILKGVCKSHDATSGDLAECLKDLSDRGELDRRLYDWSTALRIAGNEVEHEVESDMSRGDASDLLDFAEAVVEYVYTFKEKFASFEKRRARRPNPVKQTRSMRAGALTSS
jgi:hypothetical protein